MQILLQKPERKKRLFNKTSKIIISLNFGIFWSDWYQTIRFGVKSEFLKE